MAVSNGMVLLLAGYALGVMVREDDKFLGNFVIFIVSASTLLIASGNGENALAVGLTVLSLGNVIVGVLTSRK